MTFEAPIAFTVTPYHEDGSAAVAKPGRSRDELVGSMICGLAAVGTVLASFLSVERIVFGSSLDGGASIDDGDGNGLTTLPRQVISVSGWGRVHVSPQSIDSFSSSSSSTGPVYGVLFCICAGLLALAAVWQFLPRSRTRWVPALAPAVVGALLLLGSAGTLMTEIISQRARTSNTGFEYGAGIGLYLVVASAVGALLPGLYRHWQSVRGAPVPAVPARQNQPTETELVQDLGTSPF